MPAAQMRNSSSRSSLSDNDEEDYDTNDKMLLAEQELAPLTTTEGFP